MPRTTLLRGHARMALPLLLLWIAGGLTSCSDPLEVSDPTAILEGDVNNADGAELLRRASLKLLYSAGGESAWSSGLLADEFRVQQPALNDLLAVSSPDELLDRRNSAEFYERYGDSNPRSYQEWQRLWTQFLPVALAKLRAYAVPGAREAHVGEMLAVRGFVAMRLAEDFCPGFPLHQVVDYKVSYGPPLSTERAFEHALAAYDSAVSSAADSARVLNFARVGRARTLLNLGRFAEAAIAVADVPTGYVYQAEYNTTVDPFQPNVLAKDMPGWASEGVNEGRRSVANREGTTGLDFVSAKDPRVRSDSLGVARDSVTTLYGIAKYPNRGAPMVLANGTEARLIEAEAALRAGDYSTWLTKLNQLRQTVALPDTTDPGTADARVDLTFRERAFWLFATGHRLGDLRRLVRQYGRTSGSVFPNGGYWRGGSYGNATSLPFDTREAQFSPGVTGCTGG